MFILFELVSVVEVEFNKITEYSGLTLAKDESSKSMFIRFVSPFSKLITDEYRFADDMVISEIIISLSEIDEMIMQRIETLK